MIIEARLTDDDIERIATRLAELFAVPQSTERWFDVGGAGDHLGLTENAVRGLVKRRQIPFHRTANGRLRFAAIELDQWVRTSSCEPAREDLP